jgi:hypothetical protein
MFVEHGERAEHAEVEAAAAAAAVQVNECMVHFSLSYLYYSMNNIIQLEY